MINTSQVKDTNKIWRERAGVYSSQLKQRDAELQRKQQELETVENERNNLRTQQERELLEFKLSYQEEATKLREKLEKEVEATKENASAQVASKIQEYEGKIESIKKDLKESLTAEFNKKLAEAVAVKASENDVSRSLKEELHS